MIHYGKENVQEVYIRDGIIHDVFGKTDQDAEII
jgi:hypothetical protein